MVWLMRLLWPLSLQLVSSVQLPIVAATAACRPLFCCLLLAVVVGAGYVAAAIAAGTAKPLDKEGGLSGSGNISETHA